MTDDEILDHNIEFGSRFIYIEHLCEAMHAFADGISTDPKATMDALGVREIMFVFIDRLRRIIRGQDYTSQRLDYYLESKTNNQTKGSN